MSQRQCQRCKRFIKPGRKYCDREECRSGKARFARWYEQNREKYNAARRAKYEKDAKYRKRVRGAASTSRAKVRKARADEKFDEDVRRNLERRPDKVDGVGRSGHPRFAEVDGTSQWVVSTRYLADRVGRTQSTVRVWLNEGVLPGCSIVFGHKYYFTLTYVDVIVRAVKRLYREDGNGSRDVLKRIILEELKANGNVSWVPVGGGARIKPEELWQSEEKRRKKPRKSRQRSPKRKRKSPS